MLKTKSILELKNESDGLRISIMSRHHWSSEIIKYTNINKINPQLYDLWWKELAPSENLVGDLYKRKLPWNQFEQRYLAEINKLPILEKVKDLAHRSLTETITLLCLEKSPKYCHRRILAEECKKYEPLLILSIK